ncbi:MAG TPA: NADH-dependent [FeFe] hydrogenase, group A6 [Candidatus Ozemobacteraceae bacterium]
MSNTTATVLIDNRPVPIEGERNILEMVRKAGIELPTFCYHSDLSIYGACRMCMVHVEGRGLMAACSTKPEPGMKVKTTTEEIREMRKIVVELLLANHDGQCPTCAKSAACTLQNLSRRLGITTNRFKPIHQPRAIDVSSPSLVRDPNKCVLCGDCVRMCAEIQGIGAIDFAGRGRDAAVLPAFGKNLEQVECVNCGQCAAVCPTGALTVRSDVEDVWKLLDDPSKTVIAEIAPAVRVALGEMFGLEAGEVVTGQAVAALKTMGFKKVFDTSFSADLTVIEEAEEFLTRFSKGEKLPQFTSCCPAWVKYAEQYHPELLPNLSSCKSPQQMFGSIARDTLPKALGIENKNLVIVSIMPCTAKKFEARRSEFAKEGIRDVDYVLTTQEFARMIEERGIDFRSLSPESLDMPLGFKTGAGVIFGASGGVTEAVLRYAAEKVTGRTLENVDFVQVRGEDGRREIELDVAGKKLKLCVVHSLANARKVADEIKKGKSSYHLIEVMACPGGCVGGAGQPLNRDVAARRRRAKGLYDADKTQPLHKAQENPYIAELYQKNLGEVGGHKAHELLHTHYHSRRRLGDTGIPLITGTAADKLKITVCVGTSCYVKGSQTLLQKLVKHLEEQGLTSAVDVQASFCHERCDRGPTVVIGDRVIEKCTLETAIQTVTKMLSR